VSPTRRLFGYVRRLPGQYLLGAVLTLGYAVVFQFIPLRVRDIVSAIESEAGMPAVTHAAFWLIATALVFAGFRFSSRIVMFRCGRQIEYQIRNDFFGHLQRLPQSFFNAHRTGDLMSRAVNDINSVRLFLGMGLLNIVQTPVLYLGAVVVMLAVDPILTLWVLSPYPLFVGIARLFGRRMFFANLAAQEQLGDVSAAVQENASGTLVVRSYALEDRERSRFEAQNQRLFRRTIRVAVINGLMMPVLGLLPALAMTMTLVLWRGGAAVQAARLASADLWVFYIYITLLTFPTFIMGFVIMMVQRGLAALQRLGEVLDTVPSIRDRADAVGVDPLEGAIELRHLHFAYPDLEREPALRDVSLRVEAGQTIGIVGSVGSGKSTLVSTVPRLLEVPDGSVLIDDHDVNRLPLHLLRSSIAMVPQDSFLFSTTIAENIRFGCPDASLDEVREAARRAYVLTDIEGCAQGFDTPVGERGITLSGGQRQRIALARALILDPAILILDDALSSVDHSTEEEILKELRSAKAGRTCLIVAHRLSAVRDASRIVVLEARRLIEEGTHEDLVRQAGFYAKLHHQQLLEEELESEDVA
jgi:ATP-binding cassette subfamily B protein